LRSFCPKYIDICSHISFISNYHTCYLPCVIFYSGNVCGQVLTACILVSNIAFCYLVFMDTRFWRSFLVKNCAILLALEGYISFVCKYECVWDEIKLCTHICVCFFRYVYTVLFKKKRHSIYTQQKNIMTKRSWCISVV